MNRVRAAIDAAKARLARALAETDSETRRGSEVVARTLPAKKLEITVRYINKLSFEQKDAPK